MEKNTLYVVGLPIGNLQDITYRALDILKTVQCIYAEDTRKFMKFQQHFQISTSVFSYHDHNERIKSPQIIKDLLNKTNYNLALVSDAGTPMISDPGYHLITQCYENNIPVIPIPGVSAVTCALSCSPFNCSDFRFIGFFTKDKVNLIKNTNSVVVFFESPKRVKETLQILKENLPERKVLIGREMTKSFESFYYFSLNNIPEIPCLGEFIFIIEPPKEPAILPIDFKFIVEKFTHIKTKDLVELICHITNTSKKKIYTEVIKFL